MRPPSGPCEKSDPLLIAQLCLPALLAISSAGPTWRLSAEPVDASETALHDAVLRDGQPGLDALAALSRQNPETQTSGLARLAAGLRLLDVRRYAEAIGELSHPDVQRTALRDHACVGLGRAEEALGRLEPAARWYLAAAAEPSSGLVCTALPRAAEIFQRARRPDAAVSALEQAVAACPRDLADTLLALGNANLAAGDRAAAAAAFDRLDRELPGSAQANQAHAKLGSLADQLPRRTAEERARLALQRGTALLSAGRNKEALEALRAVTPAALPAGQADLARVALARALFTRGRVGEGRKLLGKIAADSPQAAEAAFLLARESARRAASADAFQSVADDHPGTPWGEEALLSLANYYQKDALDDAALTWWRRLLAEYPDGRYVERAAARVGWADYRARRYAAAAVTLESAARLRPPSSFTAGLLYWAARAHMALDESDRARLLLEETIQRYAHTYHGLRASEALTRLGGAARPRPALRGDDDAPGASLPEPRATRVHQLLLLERPEAAIDELRLLPDSSLAQATIAWIEWRRGRYRPALVTMKRAFPEWIAAAGDRLPPEVWRILFPLRYEQELRATAERESLDPALVAALILQESTFDSAALSRAGARGLMQVMPATGRRIARAEGKRFRRAALHDPGTSLSFGGRYLRQMSERFGGAIERVLAAYNAGPHRVDAWTAAWGDLGSEEFIESIPFSETRSYVMTILANREQYRRLYEFGRTEPGRVTEGARP